MKLLVLHRIPYHKICYHRGINHDLHDVTYVGTSSALDTIPKDLRCRKIERPGVRSASDEILDSIDATESYDRVISLSEYELMDAAKIRAAWRVPGPSIAQVELVRNKIKMKEAVAKAGLRVPKYFKPETPEQMWDSRWTGKTVLKPVDGASSEGVAIHGTPEDALKTVVPGDRFEIEEYVNGPILHLDGLVQNGELIVFEASQYVGTCLDFAQGSPLGSVQLEPSEKLEAWSKRCLSAVQLTDGAFHLEAILTPSGPVFLEIANRVGGADVVDTFELATGIHLPAMELRILLGEKIRIQRDLTRDQRFGWFVFPGHHLNGERCIVMNSDRFRHHPGIYRWNQLDEKQPLTKRITYQAHEVPVAGVIQGSSSEEVESLMTQILSSVQVGGATSSERQNADRAC